MGWNFAAQPRRVVAVNAARASSRMHRVRPIRANARHFWPRAGAWLTNNGTIAEVPFRIPLSVSAAIANLLLNIAGAGVLLLLAMAVRMIAGPASRYWRRAKPSREPSMEEILGASVGAAEPRGEPQAESISFGRRVFCRSDMT